MNNKLTLDFNLDEYIRMNPDNQTGGVDPRVHYLNLRLQEKNSLWDHNTINQYLNYYKRQFSDLNDY